MGALERALNGAAGGYQTSSAIERQGKLVEDAVEEDRLPQLHFTFDGRWQDWVIWGRSKPHMCDHP